MRLHVAGDYVANRVYTIEIYEEMNNTHYLAFATNNKTVAFSKAKEIEMEMDVIVAEWDDSGLGNVLHETFVDGKL